MKCPVLLASYFIRLVITRAGESGGAVIAMSPSPPFFALPVNDGFYSAWEDGAAVPIGAKTEALHMVAEDYYYDSNP